MTDNPVLVIGLDGATFDLLRPWAQQGILPNLKKLMDASIKLPLMSTVPPITGPAWSSFSTGKHPGKHGNVDFCIRGDNYSIRTISSRTIQGKTLWQLLTQAQKRICVIDVPITYPPTPVNGVMITGMMTPAVESEFTYPPELKQTILDKWPDYALAVPWRDYEGIGIERLIEDLRAVTEQRADLVLDMLGQEAWDFFMCVFVGMDRIQHCLWRFMDPQHPTYDVELADQYLPMIKDYYRLQDQVVGRILDAAPDNANVMLMSDHGFGPLWKEVDLNRWLAAEGLLSYASGRQGITSQVWQLGRRIAHSLPALQKMFANGYGKKLKENLWQASLSSAVDWRQTKAYCHAHGGIIINLAGRETEGIVPTEAYESLRDELIERLQNLVDPETGQRIIYRAQRREEVYQGKAVELAPDVVVTEADERYYLGFVSTPNLLTMEETRWKSGYHRYDGIFIASGPDFGAQTSREEASIADLMPTILYLLGLPVPQECDGQVLLDVVAQPFVGQHEVTYSDEADSDEVENDLTVDKDEEELLVDRLRSLGYM
ncbi:MAG: alkaline phosphatase family protein [Chloroflexota bacterium]